MGLLKSHWFHILQGQSFSHSIFVEERGRSNLWLNCHFSVKRNVHIYITIVFQFKCWKYCFQVMGKIVKRRCYSLQKLQLYLGNTELETSRFVQILLPDMQYSLNIDQSSFFYSWDRPWYSDDVCYFCSLGFVQLLS